MGKMGCCWSIILVLAIMREASPLGGAPIPRTHNRAAGRLCFAGPCNLHCQGGGNLQASVCKSSWHMRLMQSPRTWRCEMKVDPVTAGEPPGDEFGALLRTWGVEDARSVLESNGFTSVQRVRDVLEPDDLPELGLPLATRKILARLIKHFADQKREETDALLSQKVASLLDSGAGVGPPNANDEENRAAFAAAEKLQDALYNADAPRQQLRRWQPFHRVISETIASAAGSFELRGVEEIQLDAPVNTEALNTSLAPLEGGDDSEETVPLSSGRGGRYEAVRKRVLAPPPTLEPGKKQKRHFRYRSREGDFFVKVVLTGEPVDNRCDDEKEDAAGDMLKKFMMGGELGDLNNLDNQIARLSGSASADFGGGRRRTPLLDFSEGTDTSDLDSLVMSLDLKGSKGASGAGAGGGGGLILDIPEDLKLQLFGAEEEAVKGLKYPHNLYEGEQVALRTLRSTGQMSLPAPIVAGDLLEAEYVKNHLDAKFAASDLFSGGYGVLEWVELKRDINPLIVSEVAQQLARVHLCTEGMSSDYGFAVNTFLGEIEQDNTMSKGVDVLDFFSARRLEPELERTSRASAERAAQVPPKLRDEIGIKGFQLMQRVQESEVWRDLIFAAVREQGPCLLHGDLWLGNMAVDPEKRPYVVGPASWFGPADFDLAVGDTFGMPERFRQAYHHYYPKLEGSKERGMLYRLYVLLNHLNQPPTYKYSSNVQREPHFRYEPDNFLGGKTLTSFRTTSVLNPGKHTYRSEMEMITRGGWYNYLSYAKEINELMNELIAISPPKSGSKGQVFKFWGKSKPDYRAKRINPPDGIKLIPFGYGGGNPKKL